MELENKWYDIIGLEGEYQINISGEIKSLEKIRPAKQGSLCTKKERILQNCYSHWGYKYNVVIKDGKRKCVFAHKALAEIFIPNPERKTQVNHIDGNKLNNKLSNLEWCTPKENSTHSALVLGNSFGEKNGNSKLNKENVEEIRKTYKPFVLTRKMLGDKFGVTKNMIDKILQRRNWA